MLGGAGRALAPPALIRRDKQVRCRASEHRSAFDENAAGGVRPQLDIVRVHDAFTGPSRPGNSSRDRERSAAHRVVR
jgi:hypothetical protein